MLSGGINTTHVHAPAVCPSLPCLDRSTLSPRCPRSSLNDRSTRWRVIQPVSLEPGSGKVLGKCLATDPSGPASNSRQLDSSQTLAASKLHLLGPPQLHAVSTPMWPLPQLPQQQCLQHRHQLHSLESSPSYASYAPSWSAWHSCVSASFSSSLQVLSSFHLRALCCARNGSPSPAL